MRKLVASLPSGAVADVGGEAAHHCDWHGVVCDNAQQVTDM
jgi:hypothetical protein